MSDRKPPVPPFTDQLLTPRELAARLKVSLPIIRRYVATKTIPFVPVGARTRFVWDDVLAALKADAEKK